MARRPTIPRRRALWLAVLVALAGALVAVLVGTLRPARPPAPDGAEPALDEALEETTEPATESAEESATVTGRVTAREGAPVAGAELHVVREGSGTASASVLALGAGPGGEAPGATAASKPGADLPSLAPRATGDLGVLAGPIPPIPSTPPPSPGPSGPAPAMVAASMVLSPTPDARTDDNGMFTLTGLAPGRVQLVARHPGFVETWSAPLTLTAGASETVNLVLDRGGRLEGHVREADGAPAAGLRALLLTERGALSSELVTGTDGAFTFDAVPARARLLIARANGKPVLTRFVTVGEGQVVPLELTLPPAREDVTVEVVDAAGAPVPGALVSAVIGEAAPTEAFVAVTDEHGQAVLPEARDGRLALTVTAPGRAPRVVELTRAAATERVALDVGLTVVGRVTTVRGRLPVDGATVTLVQGAARLPAVTGSTGEYRVAGVAEGPARLTVERADYAPVEIALDLAGRRGSTIELPDVDLVAAATVRGVVVDAGGAPVAGARVTLKGGAARSPTSTPVATTDAEGEFVLRRVPSGEVSLVAEATGAASGDAASTSEARGPLRATATVTLPAGGELDGVELRLAPQPAPAREATVPLTLAERDEGESTETLVVQVPPGGAAERAGVEAGDVLAEVDGKRPANLDDARRLLAGAPNTEARLVVLRDGARRTLTVRRETPRR